MGMISENCKFGEDKWLLNEYQKINDAKEYGSIIINKSKPYTERYTAVYPLSKKHEILQFDPNYKKNIY